MPTPDVPTANLAFHTKPMHIKAIILLSISLLGSAASSIAEIDAQIASKEKRQLDINVEILNLNNGSDPNKAQAISEKNAELVRINQEKQELVNKKAGLPSGSGANTPSPRTVERQGGGEAPAAASTSTGTSAPTSAASGDATTSTTSGSSEATESSSGGGDLKVKGIPERNPDNECITEEQFQKAVAAYEKTGVGKPPVPSTSLYEAYKKYVCAFLPLKEQAQFLTNIVWESGGLVHRREIACNTGNCEYKNYYGRGFIQLTWDYNYKECSADLFGDDRLVRDPDMVAKSDELAWLTAVWFWNKRVAPWLKYKKAVENNDLGMSVRVINGGIECSAGPNEKAQKRLEIYKQIRKDWKIEGEPTLTSCTSGVLNEKPPAS